MSKDCKKSHTKKYKIRPGPPYPAQDCKSHVKKGNDKLYYKSVPDKNGVYKWKNIESIKSKAKKKTKSKANTKSKKKTKSKNKKRISHTPVDTDCVKSNTKKYSSRPSPSYPAQNCKNYIILGNDDLYYYKSVPDKNGIYKWKKLNDGGGMNVFFTPSSEVTPRPREVTPKPREVTPREEIEMDIRAEYFRKIRELELYRRLHNLPIKSREFETRMEELRKEYQQKKKRIG